MANKSSSKDSSSHILEQVNLDSPIFCQVVLLNDNYTTMQFVVSLLVSVFGKSQSDAYNIMVSTHTKGEGVCGTYPYDIAELKAELARSMAKDSNEPLRIVVREI